MRLEVKEAAHHAANSAKCAVGYLDSHIRSEMTEAQHALDLFLFEEPYYGWPHSRGSKLGNYWGYMCNAHPFWGLIFAHKDSPFSRKERRLVMFNSLCFTFVVTMLFEYLSKDISPTILAFVESLILVPYDTALKSIATCKFCRTRQVLVKSTNCMSLLVLRFLALVTMIC